MTKFATPCLRRSALATAMVLILALHFPLTAAPQNTTTTVRKASFAGSFYPADRATLDKNVSGYLKAAESKGNRTPAPIIGIIAPHAGYQYSGGVAGSAYSALKGGEYKTVILLGPSHQTWFKGVSVDLQSGWETPLGIVPVDHETARTLLERCKFAKPYTPAFQREHSLEVQLPFLQKTLGKFKIVPLATGSMDDDDYAALASVLASLVKDHPRKILIVASSDMSHYHPYDLAKTMDRLALADMESLDVPKLTGDIRKGKCELCGLQAVVTLISVARSLGAEAHILSYANSGDVTGDRDRVVGYGAIAFSLREGDHGLDKREQGVLLSVARKAVEASVLGKRLPQPDIKDSKLQEKRGAFVTLRKKGDLRGCVGYVAPVRPLYEAVSEMAMAASSRDTRFRPVSREELKDIHIEISVLSPMKPVTDPTEIEVGRHGLYITRGGFSGLLLPQVASEYSWNRDEFLRQTCIKAGLPSNSWKEKGTNVYSFSAQIFSE